MRPPRGAVPVLLTHALAAAAGWAVFQTTEPAPPESAAAPAAVPRRPLERLGSTRDSAEAAGREILDKVLAGMDENIRVVAPQPGAPPDFVARIDSIVVPADIGAALERLLAESAEDPTATHAERLALSYHWLTSDPEGFFQWARTQSGLARVWAQQATALLAGEILRRNGAEEFLEIARISGSPAAAAAVAAPVAGQADAATARLLMEALDSQARLAFAQQLGRGWPAAQADALVALAKEMHDPSVLFQFLAGQKGRTAFLVGLLEDPASPSLRGGLLGNPEILNLILHDPAVPLSLRQSIAPLSYIVRVELDQLFRTGRDLPFAFRRGEMTAQEVLDHVRASSPEVAAAAPEEIRDRVFRELAEEDPTRALALLDDMPADERANYALHVSRSHFENVEPDKFLELLGQIPVETQEQWEGRLDAWNRRTFSNHERLRSGFVDWVRALPPGLDREMALYGLARAVDHLDDKLAWSLRAQVTDPVLKQRIALHR